MITSKDETWLDNKQTVPIITFLNLEKNTLMKENIEIFSYAELKKKTEREIARLEIAENNMDEITAADYALNAAFTIYHLFEWHEKTTDPSSKNSAYSLCKNINNSALNILHSIATRNKHVTVSKPLHANDCSPKIEENLILLCTEDGKPLLTENNKRLITENSKIIIYFGDEQALLILKEALKEFK